MLQSEIAPFADYHIKHLEEVRQLLQSIAGSYNGVAVGITLHDVAQAVSKTTQAIAGVQRFKTCALDEWQQKERAIEYANNCRLNHRDQ